MHGIPCAPNLGHQPPCQKHDGFPCHERSLQGAHAERLAHELVVEERKKEGFSSYGAGLFGFPCPPAKGQHVPKKFGPQSTRTTTHGTPLSSQEVRTIPQESNWSRRLRKRGGVPSTAPLHEVRSTYGLRLGMPRNHGGDGAPYAHNPTPCGPTGGSIACPTPLPKAEAWPTLWRWALRNSNET